MANYQYENEPGKVRLQSSLGSQLERRYKDGKNIHKVLLAQVTQVHHRYNTVEVTSLSDDVRTGESYFNNGKFSAKLPVGFGGTDRDGNVYGQTLPVTVGSTVLVGFVKGNKQTPIVLSVFTNTLESYELSRSPVEESDSQIETLDKYTNHLFKVYPSMTYDDIDGLGNRFHGLNGRSFMLLDSDSSSVASGYNDDGIGTLYEDLPSSHYYSGKLIDPKETKAPTFLFKHQGDKISLDNESGIEDDNHAFMVFIDQDGTFRQSMINTQEDWRSQFEIRPTGRLSMKYQTDSKKVNGTDNYHEIFIDEEGIGFKVGDKYTKLTPNGSRGNLLLPGGGSSGGMTEQERSQLDEDLLYLKTGIEVTDESVKAFSNKLTQTEEYVNRKTADWELTAESIRQEVEDTKLLNNETLQNISKDVKDIHSESETMRDMIDQIVLDNKIDSQEKGDLYLQYAVLRSEHDTYIRQLDDTITNVEQEIIEATPEELLELEPYLTNFKSIRQEFSDSFIVLKDTVEPIFTDMENTTEINSVEFRDVWNRFLNAKTNALNAIYEHLNRDIWRAADQAIQAGRDANSAMTLSNELRYEAKDTAGTLKEIFRDGQVTAEEKRHFRSIINNLDEDVNTLIPQATEYGVPTTELENQFDKVSTNSVTNEILQTMTYTTTYTETEANTIQNHINRLVELLNTTSNKITDRTIELLKNYEGDLTNTRTQLTETAEEIKAVSQQVEIIGEQITVQESFMRVAPGLAESGASATYLVRSIRDGRDRAIASTGDNLYVIRDRIDGYLTDSGVTSKGNSGDTVTNYIPVLEDTVYTLTVNNNLSGSTEVKVSYYNYYRNHISTVTFTGVDEQFRYELTTPEGTNYVRIATQNSNDLLIMFEQGRGSSYYTPSLQDITYNIEQATENADIRRGYMEELNTLLGEYSNGREPNINSLRAILEDGTVTDSELPTIQEELDRIKELNTYTLNEALSQGEPTLGYELEYEPYRDELQRILDNHTQGVESTYSSPNALFTLGEDFYEAGSELARILFENAEESYQASVDLLDEVSKNAVEAQRIADENNRKIVDASQSLATVEGIIARFNEIETEHLEKLELLTENSVIKPREMPDLDAIVSDTYHMNKVTKALVRSYGIPTDSYDQAYQALVDYYATLNIPENWTTASGFPMSYEELSQPFIRFYEESRKLQEEVRSEASKLYETLDFRSIILNQEAIRRQEQLQNLHNAVRDSEMAIERVQQNINDLNTRIPYSMSITSTNGLTFLNNIIDTQLIARVYYNNNEVTGEIPKDYFQWTKVKEDGTEDIEWNNAHKGIGNVLDIDHWDIDDKATFNCDVYKDVPV